MRRMNYLLLTLVVVFIPQIASAQVPLHTEEHPVNQYLQNADEARSDAWWNALGRRLTLKLDRPVEQIDVAALQNIIYFANHHADQVRFDDAVPFLQAIAKAHPEEPVRLMAVVALHKVGTGKAMRAVSTATRDEESERVRRIAAVVLNHYTLSQRGLIASRYD